LRSSDLREVVFLAPCLGLRPGWKSLARGERGFAGIRFGIPFGDSACPTSQKYQPRADGPKKIGISRLARGPSAQHAKQHRLAQLGGCRP